MSASVTEVHVTYLLPHVDDVFFLFFLGGYASMHNNYFMLSAREGFN